MNEMIELDLADKRHRALKRLMLARRDIDAARDAINYLIVRVKSEKHPLFDPLSCAAVIYYAKPFIHCRECPSLPRKYSVFPEEEMHSLHDAVIEHRNKVVAHSDEDVNLVSLIPKGSEVTWAGGKGKGIVSCHGDSFRFRYLALRVFPFFKKLCDFQLSRLRQHISLEKEELFPIIGVKT